MSHHKSIFAEQNQSLVQLFESAGRQNKVMCVAIDYAKGTHVALCCNGEGKVLKAAFPVKNSPEGVEFLLEQVAKLCRKHHIEREHVFMGGEDCGTFALNMIYELRNRGFLVLGVNAEQAAKARQNQQASTDKLDLLGIATVLLNKRGSLAGGELGALRALRSLTRHRRRMVQMKTATGNRIHQLVDQLFPGFLEERKSGIPPFSKASLFLMEKGFSARSIARRQDRVLLRQLQAQGLQLADKALPRLKASARATFNYPGELTGLLQVSLQMEVRMYRCLLDNIEQVGYEIAQQLAQTPAAMVTTVRGIGITLAAGVSAEIGAPESQPSLRQLCSYAGIVPRLKQTGGPEKSATIGRVSRRSNHILKDYVVQCGNHLGLHGPAELMEDYARRKANGQHADFAMARRFLRLAMKLQRTGLSYVPSALHHCEDSLDPLREYYLTQWPKLLNKWVKAKAVKTAFAPKNPLGKWRITVQELYDIQLPLPPNQ